MTKSIPLLTYVVRDYDEAIAFLVDALRFTVVEDTPLGDGKRWVVVAPAASRGASLLLGKAATPEQVAHVGNQTGGRVFLFLHTDDFWDDYRHMQAHGVRFAEEPREEPYGRVVVFFDLYGNTWDLVQPRTSMAPEPNDPSLLHEQLAYYRARAAEYDQWWLRQGRYDRGAALNAQWFGEAAQVSAELEAFRPAGRILELACGTGKWSEQLLPYASELTLVDGSSEMLAIATARLGAAPVRTLVADLFTWEPAEQADVVFFGFWLSHVPPDRFDGFWALVDRCLAPGGRVFFVDSRYTPASTAVDHILPEPHAGIVQRRLNDGREFQVVKIFYDPADLAGRLFRLGWQIDVRQTERYFLYGSGCRRGADL